MPPGEVITLQLGGFANYVGAHYWNLQDELLGMLQGGGASPMLAPDIDFNVLYREGMNAQGHPTYTPRMLLLDMRGCLGGSREEGGLYAGGESDAEGVLSAPAGGAATWRGRTAVYRHEPVPRSAFQEQLQEEAEQEEEEAAAGPSHSSGGAAAASPRPLDTAADALDAPGGVRYWTDYLKAELHPRSVQQLPGLWQGVSAFGGWGDGAGLWRGEGVGEEAMDRVRRWAEECDHLQGFQVFADDLSGFGALAADGLAELREEYHTKPILLWAPRRAPLQPARGADAGSAAHIAAAAGAALSLAALTEHVNVFCPLNPPEAGLPHVVGVAGGEWSTYRAAALLAAVLDSATLPYRLDGGAVGGPLGRSTGAADMHGLAQLLSSGRGPCLAAAALALPCAPLPASADAVHAAHDARARVSGGGGGAGGAEAGELFTRDGVCGLTQGLPFPDADVSAEALVLRGPRSAAADCAPCTTSSAASILDASLMHEGVCAVQQRTVCAQPLALPLPFPQLFGPRITRDGCIAPPGSQRARTGPVVAAPVLCRTWASSAASGYASTQLATLQRTWRGVAGRTLLQDWGIGTDEVADAQEKLHGLQAAWADDFSD